VNKRLYLCHVLVLSSPSPMQQTSLFSDMMHLGPGSVLVCECLFSVHMPVAASLYP